MKRPNTNITPVERLGRVLIGLIGVIGGLILLGSAGSAIVAVQATAMMMVGMSHGDGGGR